MLPARRVGVPVVGVSGKQYSAWVTKPPERVGIRSFKQRDHVSAILTLDDGRKLLVQLTGSLETVAEGTAVIPVIQLVVDAPELASLSPEQLKVRLHLLVENGSWCGVHWDDTAMSETSRRLAEEKAADSLDWATDAAVAELQGAISRESLLHWLTKEILLKERRIRAPSVEFRKPWRGSIPADAQLLDSREPAMLQLSDVRLEKKVGQIRPDVLAQYIDPSDGSSGLLLIEVTVTNEISPERLTRIKREGLATLEINIGSLGGTLSKLEFTQLVTDELTAKEWLHHPWLEMRMAAYQAEVALHEQDRQRELAELRARFLKAIEVHSTLRALDLSSTEGREERKQALKVVRALGIDLVSLGFEAADANELFASQGCILDRLLSIRDSRVIGYRVQSLWEVINAILCEKEPYLEWQTLYLTALKVYAPPLKADHQRKVNNWRNKVLDSLRNGEATYRRRHRFDELLGFLFPEMANDLKKPLPDIDKAQAGEKPPLGKISIKHPSPSHVESGFTNPQQIRNSLGLWLKGAEYEEWKRQHPEAAQAWEQNIPNRKT